MCLLYPVNSASHSPLQETREHFLVLFSFHLLILSLDHSRQDFSYEVFFILFKTRGPMGRKLRGKTCTNDCNTEASTFLHRSESFIVPL